MVGPTPPSGSLVRKLGHNHARLGMEPMHRECREYMEGYKEYSLTTNLEHTILKAPTKERT